MDTEIPFLLTVEFDGGPELKRTVARLQITARKFGFKPLWLIGARALSHPADLEPMARWQAEGEAEIGAWLLAAEVPPLVDLGPSAEGRWPALTDFPESVMDEKLTWFTETLERVAGRRPVSIRTSRASVDDRYYTLLAKHGYKVDLTVVPHAKFVSADFSGYSEKAYLTPQGIFEIPRTVRRRRYGPFVEDLLILPGFPGWAARKLFPTLRCFRLRRGNGRVVRSLAKESLKTPPEHLDLRIAARDWSQGDALVRDLQRVLATVQATVTGVTAEEFLQRFKNQQLRNGLV
jgi:hypothetical protein